MEVDEAMINRWLVTPGNVEELEELKGKIDPDNIRNDTPDYIERLEQLSDKVFKGFINLFGDKQKTKFLPSR